MNGRQPAPQLMYHYLLRELVAELVLPRLLEPHKLVQPLRERWNAAGNVSGTLAYLRSETQPSKLPMQRVITPGVVVPRSQDTMCATLPHLQAACAVPA